MKVLKVIILLFLFSCSKTTEFESTKNINCLSYSPLYLLGENNFIYSDIVSINAKKDSSQLIKEILEITHILNNASTFLLDKSGGIDPKTNLLVDPCNKGSFAKELFYKEDLGKKIRGKIKNLKKLKLGEKEKHLLTEFNRILSFFFYGEQFYFNENRILESSYSQIALDLLLVENSIYNLLIKHYE